jgi:hypothetical protein
MLIPNPAVIQDNFGALAAVDNQKIRMAKILCEIMQRLNNPIVLGMPPIQIAAHNGDIPLWHSYYWLFGAKNQLPPPH